MDRKVLGGFLALFGRKLADVLLLELAPFGGDVLAALDIPIVERLGAGELVEPDAAWRSRRAALVGAFLI